MQQKIEELAPLHLDQFTSIHGNYISPTIIEERQMNITYNGCFLQINDG